MIFEQHYIFFIFLEIALLLAFGCLLMLSFERFIYYSGIHELLFMHKVQKHLQDCKQVEKSLFAQMEIGMGRMRSWLARPP